MTKSLLSTLSNMRCLTTDLSMSVSKSFCGMTQSELVNRFYSILLAFCTAETLLEPSDLWANTRQTERLCYKFALAIHVSCCFAFAFDTSLRSETYFNLKLAIVLWIWAQPGQFTAARVLFCALDNRRRREADLALNVVNDL